MCPRKSGYEAYVTFISGVAVSAYRILICLIAWSISAACDAATSGYSSS